ncbi:MAG TPA: PIN domain-containing protein [Acidobacteriota bacterium]|nr:PIN domain-containing protein [Acidobacteriota bacterium]
MEPRAVKVFLDSNVILSGLISDRGAPRLILDLISLGLPLLRGVTGRYNLTEIERNIAGKLPAARSVLNEGLPGMNLEIVFLPFLDEMAPFRGIVDDEDLPVLVSALIAKADYFLTGDTNSLGQIAKHKAFGISPMDPAHFLDRVLPDILAGGKQLKGKDR